MMLLKLICIISILKSIKSFNNFKYCKIDGIRGGRSNVYFFPPSQTQKSSSSGSLNGAFISDLDDMNIKEAMMAVCDNQVVEESLQYPNTDILRQAPSICGRRDTPRSRPRSPKSE